MLKIWLNWLQPSLGVLGVVLVLSNAVSAHAGSKPIGKEPSIAPIENSQPKVVKPNGFTLPQQMTGAFSPTTGVSLPPDVAIRRLALDTIANSETKSPSFDSQASSRGLKPAPATAKSTNAYFVKQPLSSTAVYAPNSTAVPLVAGLFIGRSTGGTDRITPPIQPVATPVAKAVSVPTSSPAAIASAVVATPFPVMLPERMQQFNLVETVATEKKSPIVARSTRSASTVASGLQNILGDESTSQTGNALDTPVASGLQNILGNEPTGIQADSTVALNNLVVPAPKTTPPSNRGSLQLATSQSYISAVEFDLPGVMAPEPLVTSAQAIAKIVGEVDSTSVVESAQAISKAVGVKNVSQDLSTAVIQRKNNYETLISDKDLKSQSQSPWPIMSRSNSLGGLILGSRSTNEITAPMKGFKASNYSSLGIFNPTNQY